MLVFLLVSSLAGDTSLDIDILLKGSPHLDELYGSGDFKYNQNDVDSHYAYSVESLVRLFRIEQRFVGDLEALYKATRDTIESPNWEVRVSADVNPPDLSSGEFQTPPVGLYRLQALQDLPLLSLTGGSLGPSLPTSPHHLTWQDCRLVADKARDKNDLAKRVEWLQVAVKICQQEKVDDCGTVTQLLQEAIESHDNIALSHGKFVINKMFPTVTRIVPFNQTLAERHKKKVRRWQKKFAEFVEKFPMYEESSEAPADIFFGDSVAHTEKISEQCQDLPSSPYIRRHQSSLQCHHLHRQLPHLRLGPSRLEILSDSPGVAALHDLLSGQECEEMRGRGSDGMKVTPFNLGQAGHQQNTFSDRRMSKVRYVSHRRDPLARRINRRLSDALGLDLDGSLIPAEHYQLMNYGLGGHIQLHLDSNLEQGGAVEYEDRQWVVGGERLMTVMFYLSTPTGGRTVFPLLGLSSAPTAGSALVWHTVDSRGRPQQRMKHLGCPVVTGDKWILNKWVKWHHHMFSHPCHRDTQFYSFS